MAVVCLCAAPRVQLFVSADKLDNGWPRDAPRYHWLLPISCHFQDCKSASGHESDSCKQRYSKYPTFTFIFKITIIEYDCLHLFVIKLYRKSELSSVFSGYFARSPIEINKQKRWLREGCFVVRLVIIQRSDCPTWQTICPSCRIQCAPTTLVSGCLRCRHRQIAVCWTGD